MLVRARKSSNCSNATHGDLACKSYVERTVWDGDQILIESRMNGASGLSSSELDYGSGSGEAWGDVLSVHAHGIDQPIAMRKPGATTLVPHANWMGDYEIGTTANGTVTTSCKGASNCPLILWPGSKQTVDGQLVSHSAINTWWGSLITEKTDPSGYKYMRNRYYNPQTGQFTQQDPIGLAGGVNLYGFADGDPVNLDDPFGLCPVPQLCLAAAGAAAGVIINGVVNAAQDQPFFEGWQAAAATGAMAGLTAGVAAGPEAVAGVFARAAAATTVGGVSSGTAARVMLEGAKQGKHIPGHNNYLSNRSTFTHSNPQGLLDRFAGTGQRVSGVRGQAGFKERVDFGEVIGRVNINGVMTNTTKGLIHYSKKGAHIIPANP